MRRAPLIPHAHPQSAQYCSCRFWPCWTSSGHVKFIPAKLLLLFILSPRTWSVTIDGVWIANLIYWTLQHTARDDTLKITQRLLFSVTVCIAVLDCRFQQCSVLGSCPRWLALFSRISRAGFCLHLQAEPVWKRLTYWSIVYSVCRNYEVTYIVLCPYLTLGKLLRYQKPTRLYIQNVMETRLTTLEIPL